jgi:hypothetical protein
MVEIRDRNDLPIAGVPVTFTIGTGGGASFAGGAQTLTVVTNAAGRAIAAGLTPTANGALQISASAAFQGETAVATIAQTNVLTAAQAAAAGSGAAASGGAGGAGGAGGGSSAAGATGGAAGGAGGGGFSATTIGIVGGAAAAGAVVVKEVVDKGGNDFINYGGPFSGSFTTNLTAGCSVVTMHTGTVTLEIKTADDGTVTGTGGVTQTRTVTQGNPCAPNSPVGSSQNDGCCQPNPEVHGTAANLTFTGSHAGLSGTNWTYDFTGAKNGAEITGTFTLTVTSPAGPTNTASFPVTLR